ncbi:hypothetical protein JAAARDRAFT_60035 [Jaapia argillacea MUCL 33604]|uniref:Mid2 domain-containing protein n=1 Tax=Jaapia argillacea MUCL 33604 TaxID=933084 RepID=A0A067PJR5_9AGAM|nr:hypothetical protein JAAARDRAFT_60035 [Jaapia argillacea MUCL 33604]
MIPWLSSGLPLDILVLLQLAILITRSSAQKAAFKWGINDTLLTTFQECQNLTLYAFAAPNTTTLGRPPYYVIAFQLGGFTTVDYAGMDPLNLHWTVNHRANSSLMLTMADADGNAGGIAPTFYNITAATSPTTCNITSTPDSSFVVVSNITDNRLKTCQQWGLTVKGGKPPYNISLAALNSPIVTNVTLGPGNDVMTYIDRADPNGKMLGRWGISTQPVNTYGSTNVDCTGLVTTFGNSTQVKTTPTPTPVDHTGVIVGVTIPLLLIAMIAGAVLYMRKKKMWIFGKQFDNRVRPWHEGPLHEPDTIPPVYPAYPAYSRTRSLGPTNQALGDLAWEPLDPSMAGCSDSPPTAVTPFLADTSSDGSPHSPYPYRMAALRSTTSPLDESVDGSSSSGDTSKRRRKGAAGPRPRGASGVGSSANGAGSSSAGLLPTVEGLRIVQHQDGGVVAELPPPYADYRPPGAPATPDTRPQNNP